MVTLSQFSFITIFKALLLSLVLASSAQVYGDLPQAPSQMQLLDNERKLMVGDRIIYEVLEEREDPLIVFVDDQGHVRLPLIGRVPAAGKSPQQLSYEVKAELEKEFFYQATVLMRHQFADNARGRVTLVGQVRQPGPIGIPVDQVLTVTGAILRAGGITPGGDGRRVMLVRKDPANPDAEERQFVMDVNRMLDSGDFSQDMPVQSDDLIVIPRNESTGGQVYVVGAVNAPGLYEIPPEREFTVSKAILRAGDFTRFADKKRVKLIRSDENLSEKERTVIINVADVLERGRRDNDPVVKPNDIIRIEERAIVF